MKRSCLVLACVAMAAEASGQNLPVRALESSSEPAAASRDASGGVFRSAIEIVALNVVVTDGEQRFVNGLLPDDFTVLEDGVRQEVTYFATASVPLDLAILLDTSASMAASMPVVRRAARGFLATLRQGDRAMVVSIKDQAAMAYPLGPDIAGASGAIDSAEASGGTALYNALYIALKELRARRQARGDDVRRQAIVVLSDGLDTSSLLTFDDVMEVARESGVAIYTITLKRPSVLAIQARAGSASRPLDSSDYGMRALAQETGARAFFPQHAGELEQVYGVIAADLAHQYAMAYTPKQDASGGAYRRIQVRVADRPEVRTRTRSGYVASRGSRTNRLE